MNPRLWYRSASGLLILFALGHQLDFRRSDPHWGVDSVIEAMKSVHFQADGFSRSYWDFFSGFGFFITVLLVFVAILSWQLGGLSKETLQSLTLVRWTLALSFVVIAFLNWRYFFIVPLAFSALIAICLLIGATSSRSSPATSPPTAGTP